MGKEKNKVGSRLSASELNCFKRVVIPTNLKLKTESNFNESNFNDVKAIIRRHTESLLKLFRSGQVKEDVVQKNSLDLLNELNGLFGEQFRVLNKTSGSNEIKYKTVLTNEIHEHVANVNGETDEVMFFGSVCVHYIEDKALREDLSATNHLTEALAELKGFAEAFKSACGREARWFWGIMRNGVDWLFLRRHFSRGSVMFAVTEPIKIAEDPTSQSSSSRSAAEFVFDESNLNAVTTFVCNIMSDVHELTKIIGQVGRGEVSESDEESHEDGSEAGDSDEEHDDYEDNDKKRERDEEEEELPDPKKQTIAKGGHGSKHQKSLSGLSVYDMIGRWNYLHSLPLAMRKYVEV